MTGPDHNWIVDPLAVELIKSIASHPPVPRRRKVASFSSWGTNDDTYYDDCRVEALSQIRDEYGQECLEWTDTDALNRLSPFNNWCELPDAHSLTAIVCGHPFYDPTDKFRVFAETFNSLRKEVA